jgi:hypothetical protein
MVAGLMLNNICISFIDPESSLWLFSGEIFVGCGTRGSDEATIKTLRRGLKVDKYQFSRTFN